MADQLTFQLRQLPSVVQRDELLPYFDDLPRDHYVDGNFRFRRLSRFRGPATNLTHLPHSNFMQSSYVNQLVGNIQREYEELDPGLIACPSFLGLIHGIQDFYQFDPHTTILGVHQIRITCNHDQQGEPAPEGIHQDGFDFITITCMNRVGIVGAKTEFYNDPTGEPIFSKILEPGAVAYCNDRAIYHYTTPLHPAGEESGHRDVFVVTARTGVNE